MIILDIMTGRTSNQKNIIDAIKELKLASLAESDDLSSPVCVYICELMPGETAAQLMAKPLIEVVHRIVTAQGTIKKISFGADLSITYEWVIQEIMDANRMPLIMPPLKTKAGDFN